MIFRLIATIALILAAVPVAAQDARLTAGVPVYVWHPDDRPPPAQRGWNDGWFHNEGVFADLSWPVYPLGAATHIRAGFTGGGFDNSIYDFSWFFGGMAEIEHFATDRLSLSLGGYAGILTGYANDTGPGGAPYIGAAYAVTPKVELGLRGFWLPAETVAGDEIAPSDAYITAVTVGTRF